MLFCLKDRHLYVQVLFLATIALFIGSLATVAVPKLAGDLIDICIQFGQQGETSQDAKNELNTKLVQIIGILAVGAIFTGIRSWSAPCIPIPLLFLSRLAGNAPISPY